MGTERGNKPSPPGAWEFKVKTQSKPNWGSILGGVLAAGGAIFSAGVFYTQIVAGQEEARTTAAKVAVHEKRLDAMQPAMTSLSKDLDRAADDQREIRARLDVLLELAARSSNRHQIQAAARSVAARGDNPRADHALGDLIEEGSEQ